MPPRIRLPSHQVLAYRSRPVQLHYRATTAVHSSRHYADDTRLHPNPDVKAQTEPQTSARDESVNSAPAGGHPSPEAQSNQESSSPNMDQLPHVSEEAAASSKTMGEQGPDISQGTPVGEAVKGDKATQEKLPKVMQEAMKKQSGPSGSRSFSTVSKRAEEQMSTGADASNIMPPSMPSHVPGTTPPRSAQLYPGQFHEITDEEAEQIARGLLPDPIRARANLQITAQHAQGLKFDPPAALPSTSATEQIVTSNGRVRGRIGVHMRRRYDSVVEQVTNLIMRHGKKGVAQTNMTQILTHLRTTPAPNASGKATLLPLPAHTSSLSALPLHPILYLTHAIDSVSPVMRLRSQRGIAGGGMAVQIPQPLSIRQRRRTAIMWIIDACDKRKRNVSPFAKRFAEEVVAIVEGKSGVWDKRTAVHRLAIAGRANVGKTGMNRSGSFGKR